MTPKRIVIFLVAAFFFWPITIASADVRSIHVEWEYSGIAVSYNLYKDGALVCISDAPDALMMDCNVFIETVPMTFVFTAVDADGAESPQSAPYVLVPPSQDSYGNYIPQGAIVADVTTGNVPLLVNFDASTSSDLGGVITNYTWDYGDGNVGTGVAGAHTFVATGVYTVTLTVTDDSGVSSDATLEINVVDSEVSPAVNEPPLAVITAAPLQDATSIISFDAYGSSDPDGKILTYSWNFGDGEVASGEYVEHEFLVAGDYTVVLTVIDDNGTSGQDQMLISVVDPPQQNIAPVAAISASATERLINFAWDYPADSFVAGFRFYQNGNLMCDVSDPTARTASCLVFIDNGLVQVWMVSYDDTGIESAMESEIFTFDSTDLYAGSVSGDAPLPVYFSAGNSYDDGIIESYDWNFGDGAVGTGSFSKHLYTVPGVYTVTLVVTDDAGETAQASTEVNITGNRPPSAMNSSLVTDQNSAITGTLNATDPEGDILNFSLTSNGSKGIATITNAVAGVFTYVPSVDAVGPDSFSFKVNDGVLDSNLATVIIDIQKVNRVPVSLPLEITVAENTSVSADLSATDSDGDQLIYSIVTNGAYGVAKITDNSTGAFIYTPNINFSGTDSFSFKVNDGEFDSNISTVVVTVTLVNEPPVVVDDNVVTEVNRVVKIDVLANDSDSDGDPLSVDISGLPGNGSAVVAENVIVYTPSPEFVGMDSLSYTVSDGVAFAVGRVTIEVTPPHEIVVVDWDYDASVSLSGFRLYSNGILVCETSDPLARQLSCKIIKEGGAKTFSLTAIALNGVEGAVSNLLTYDPDFNHAPVAVDDQIVVDEDSVVTIGVLVNDSDVDGDTVSIATVVQPLYGVVSVNGTSIVYTPQNNLYGLDSFTYSISDGRGGVATAKVSVSVSPINDIPVATNASLTASEDTSLSGSLTGIDDDGDSLAYSIAQKGSLGSVVITNPSTGEFSYTPDSDVFGIDQFTFNVSDGVSVSALGTVTVEIAAINDSPEATDDVVEVKGGSSIIIDVLVNDSDVDGDLLSITSVTQPANGHISLDGNAIVYSAELGFVGNDLFTYSVGDGFVSSMATVKVTVTQPVQVVNFSWDFDSSVAVRSFRFNVNGSKVCEVFDATARQANCLVPQPVGAQQFSMSYVDGNGIESTMSNVISY